MENVPAIALTASSAALLLGGLARLGSRKPGYSHSRHTISELGEIGAPHQRLVAYGLFLPIGLATLLAAILARETSGAAATLALCVSIGYLVAAVFPCDIGSPLTGSARQSVHNLGGGIEYVGGAFALFRLAEDLGAPFRIAGFGILAGAVGLSVASLASVRGLIQRVAETCLFGGLVIALWLSGTAA